MKAIQTGLRLPEPLYMELKRQQEETGVPINTQVIHLVGIGLEVIRLGQEQARSLPRNHLNTDEEGGKLS